MDRLDPLDPRLVVPLADREIVDIYQKAIAIQEAKKKEAHPYLRDEVVEYDVWETSLFAFDFVILCGLIIWTTKQIQTDLPSAIPLVVVCWVLYSVTFYLLARRAGRFAVGPLGYLQPGRRRAVRKPTGIDPNNPEVLATVIDYISETPIARAEELRTAIKAHRGQLQRTLEELPSLVESFDREIRVAENDEMLLILNSRRDSADEALRRLRQVDENLASQYDEADLAIQPLVRMRDQFERYRKLSRSLTRIQAAYELVEEGEDKVRENRVELYALYASSMSAQSKLAEIQSVMDASELAQEEVRQLMA